VNHLGNMGPEPAAEVVKVYCLDCREIGKLVLGTDTLSWLILDKAL